ncbi:hypothetical protein ABN028_05770 [Actinopolymorpha sp. B17G11]|uniref:hypothetical protein n=1 Tax=Actinopolymorpha sp. B17G11 TaxID=3160861 RepID=UPI0032E37652
MTAENLEVRVRWRENGGRSEPYRIHADPDDMPTLLRHLEELARGWRGLDSSRRWLTDYELEVKSLERGWVEFTVSGVSEDPW